MNYIKFEIGGKTRGFKFGLGFLGDIQNHFNIDLVQMHQMIEKNPLLFLPAMLYFGHKHDCIRNHEPIDFELFHFEDWIVEMDKGVSNENLLKAARAMNSGIQYISGVAEDSKEDKASKKK